MKTRPKTEPEGSFEDHDNIVVNGYAESGEESADDTRRPRTTRRRTVKDLEKTHTDESGEEHIRSTQIDTVRENNADSCEETDEEAYHDRSVGQRGCEPIRKSVNVTVLPSLSRKSPRRTTKKPQRYMDSDYDMEGMPYENLARARFGHTRRHGGSSRSAPAESRSCHIHIDRFEDDDARPRGDYEDDRIYEKPRRSGRQRKSIYDTFNQSLITMMSNTDDRRTGGEINKSMNNNPTVLGLDDSIDAINETIPPRKRSRREADPMPEEEVRKYGRVKRNRVQMKHDMYGMPVSAEEKSAEEGDGESETEEDQPNRRSYSLREHRARPELFEINWEKSKRKKHFEKVFRERTPPLRMRKNPAAPVYRSPARRKTKHRRRKATAFHSSTSSSSNQENSDSSDNERRFEQRKSKSMIKSRSRLLPMNLKPEDLAKGVLRDRAKIGASLADVDPMGVDRGVTFESVGGLGKHIRSLKEMIVFPLMYPEVFERFKITPPRGVLFYGPPGTGKTLVARALSNECSTGEKKVAFFMRKGADCLSKWVGESERQLRLLFDQAYQMRPSIIFFDEIDGLAPVRSSRQDQIHSSIVSTLLALMDGLDNRGEIVVIGATNRLDSIDPALRRPGRFDREFLFPLPTVEARKQILQINSTAWNPQLSEPFLAELAEKCTGYCGADLKALCTEAALHALRRRYPQIYTSHDKLQLDVSSISVNARDFHHGMQSIIPASQRADVSPARALAVAIRPLLDAALNRTLHCIYRMFPAVLAQLASLDAPGDSAGAGEEDELASDSDDGGPDIFISKNKQRGRRKSGSKETHGPFMNFATNAYQRPATHRPRMLLTGEEGQAQSTHIAPAVLHRMERMPVHTLDLPALFGNSAKTQEESLAQVFREAKRTAPSIIYMPHVCRWWNVIGDACRATFLSLLCDMEPSAPTLLLATSEMPYLQTPAEIQELFSMCAGEVTVMQNATDSERREFFSELLFNQAIKPPPTKRKAAQRMLEQLPLAPPPEPRQLTEGEVSRLRDHEEATLRELRLYLRDVLNKLARDRKFQMYAKPVDAEDVPDYYKVITTPMDMSMMMSKIDLCKYETVKDFLKDIELICSNALEYNPDNTLVGRAIRHRACALRDIAYSTIEQELDKEFEKDCDEIKKARKARGETMRNIPDFYFTKPISRTSLKALLLDPTGLEVVPEGTTSSRRSGRPARHTTEDPLADEPVQEFALEEEPSAAAYEVINGVKYKKVVRKERMKRAKLPQYKSVWCKPSRKRIHHVTYYIDEQGREFAHTELFGNQPIQDDTQTNSKETVETKTSETADGITPTSNTPDYSETVVDSAHSTVMDNSETKHDTKDVAKAADIERVKETTALTIYTNLNDPEAEKENKPNTRFGKRKRSLSESAAECQGHRSARSPSHGHSPRASSKSPRDTRNISSRTSHGPSPRTRSKSPRGQGNLCPPSPRAGSISPRNRSTRTRSAEKPTPEQKMEEITRDVSDADHVSEQSVRTSLPNLDDAPPIHRSSPVEMVTLPVITVVSPEKRKHSKQTAGTPNGTNSSPRKGKGNTAAKKQGGDSDNEEMETEESGGRTRVTRSRSHSGKDMERAVEILRQDTPAVTVDMNKLTALLDKVVEKSREYTIETLERLYSVLSQCIYHHRREYDKTQLISELDSSLNQFTRFY